MYLVSRVYLWRDPMLSKFNWNWSYGKYVWLWGVCIPNTTVHPNTQPAYNDNNKCNVITSPTEIRSTNGKMLWSLSLRNSASLFKRNSLICSPFASLFTFGQNVLVLIIFVEAKNHTTIRGSVPTTSVQSCNVKRANRFHYEKIWYLSSDGCLYRHTGYRRLACDAREANKWRKEEEGHAQRSGPKRGRWSTSTWAI